MNDFIKSKPIRIFSLKVIDLPQINCCKKCHTPKQPAQLTDGVCIFCEDNPNENHYQCCDCKEWFLKNEIRDLEDGYFCWECRAWDEWDEADVAYERSFDFE